MNVQGLDRRVLRAFYTQYVSVLLIMLVFFVTAFQSKTDIDARQSTSRKLTPTLDITRVRIAHPFQRDGALNDKSIELEALATLLSSHDLRADMVLTVPVLDFEGREPSLIEAARRTDLLTQFLLKRAVPATAFRFIIRQETEESSEAVSVQVLSEEERHHG